MYVLQLPLNFFPIIIQISSSSEKESTQILIVDIWTLIVAVRHEPPYKQVKYLNPEIGVERGGGGKSTYSWEIRY